jgi:uroporphyrinogen-III synthase
MSIVALGAKTAEAIEKRGYAAETFGGFQTSMALARHLKEHVLTPEHSVLLALGRMADTSVQDILEGTCRVARVNVYDTTRPAGLDTTLDVLAQTPFDAVVFSSPSAIQSVVQHQHFASLLGQKYLFCVGKTTGRALATAGLSPSLTSSSPQPGVFAREIVQFFSLQSSSLLP